MSFTNKSSNQSFWTLTRIGLIGSCIFLIAAIASALYHKDAELQIEDGTMTQPMPGSADPNIHSGNPTANPGEFLTLPNQVMQASFKLLDGKARKLADYSGKILVVDLWATWCGPCRQEIPHLIQLANEYRSRGVEVIGLTTEDPQADAQLVKDFSDEFNINYQIGWANSPVRVGLMNGRGGIPQTIIIGRDGKIRKHFVGFNPMISVPQMRAAIDEAIAAG